MLFLVWASKKYLAQDVTCLEVLSQEVLPCTPQSLSPAQASPRGGPSNAEGLECTQRDSFKWTNHRCTVSWFLVETRCPSLEKNDTFHALCSVLWKWKWGYSVTSNSLQPRGLQLTRLLRPWDSRGKSTGVGCHCLLQGIFPTQGSNPGLPHCRQTLYPLSLQGSPHAAFCNMSLFHVKKVASLCQAPCAGFGMEQGYPVTTPCVPQSSASSVHFCSACDERLLCTLCCGRRKHTLSTDPALSELEVHGDVDPGTVSPQRSREEGGRGEGRWGRGRGGEGRQWTACARAGGPLGGEPNWLSSADSTAGEELTFSCIRV